MNIETLFRKSNKFFGLDIGQSSIKVVELEPLGGNHDRFKLLHASSTPLPGDVFNNQTLSNGGKLADALLQVQEKINLLNKKAVIGLPGPSVFTKRIKVPKVDESELLSSVQFEAANYIPHNIQAVKLDYAVIKEVGKDSLEVLVVAVKNEIIDSYTDAVMMAGIQVGIADVDFFALQNICELNYPELTDKVVVLIDLGARFASLTVVQRGENLFTSDISLQSKEPKDIATDINRSLSFFWGSSGSDEQIEKILICGGGARNKDSIDALAAKTGIACEVMDPLRRIEGSESIPPEERASYAIACGLAIRAFGDRVEVPSK